jgi:hypothetical protein
LSSVNNNPGLGSSTIAEDSAAQVRSFTQKAQPAYPCFK